MELKNKDFIKILVDMKVLINYCVLYNELDHTTVSFGEIISMEFKIRFCGTLY